MSLTNTLFIARKDIAHTLRDRGALAWLFVMPVLFFYFIGTVTGGFGSGSGDTPDNVAVLVPAGSGFLAGQLTRRLEDAGYNVVSFAAETPETPASGGDPEIPFAEYCRRLTLPEGMSENVTAGRPVKAAFATCRDEISADYDRIRVQRAVYTTLADVIAARAQSGELSADALARLNATPRALTLDVRPAGKRREPPTGFQQAVPGTMVMFTLLVLLTSGAVTLLLERERGLLRRLASAPLSRGEIVLGKWLGKMALALVQLGFAMLLGWLLFRVAWQPDFAMIVVVLVAWAGVCTSCGLLLGSLGRTQGQVVGLGVLSSMLLAGLGGCWWPVEIAPAWMQGLARLLPSGWTMQALHELMSFAAGPASALPELAALLATGLVLGLVAVRRFRYE